MQTYDTDVVAWAVEQARLLRTGQFDLLDIEHIAGEIEDVGKSEQRELANRIAKLLARLLKWQYQPERRGANWETIIKVQRHGIQKRLGKSPGLTPVMTDDAWRSEIWDDAVALTADETGLADFPETCPWSMQCEVMADGWLPG